MDEFLDDAVDDTDAGDGETVDLRVHDREGLDIHFQPIVDLADGAVVGAEALLRWRHPRYGMLPAAEFLDLTVNDEVRSPMLDRALVLAAGAWVDLRTRLGGFAPDLYLNLSPAQLRDPDDVERLRHVLVATDLAPAHVVAEVADAGAMSPEVAVPLMALLTELGVRVALDHLGGNGASLRWLRELPITIVKVDGSLVRDVDQDVRARRLLAHIATLAESLELDAIIEGVETETEAEAVAEAGFRFAQGRFYAPPVDVAGFSADPVPLGSRTVKPIGPMELVDR